MYDLFVVCLELLTILLLLRWMIRLNKVRNEGK